MLVSLLNSTVKLFIDRMIEYLMMNEHLSIYLIEDQKKIIKKYYLNNIVKVCTITICIENYPIQVYT